MRRKPKSYQLVWQYAPSKGSEGANLGFEFLLRPVFDDPDKFQSDNLVNTENQSPD